MTEPAAEKLDLLRLAHRAADTGALAWSIRQDRLVVDEATERLFGIRRSTFGFALRDLVRRVREESRDPLTSALERLLSGESSIDVEVTVDLSDGTHRTLQLRGTVLHDGDGQPEHVVAAVRDVSREAGLRDQLAQAHRELAARDSELQRMAMATATSAKVNANLLARTSHDIRTRLDGLLGMSRLLLDSTLTAEQREWATTVHAQGEGMLAIVADIVDMSTTALEIEPSPVSLKSLLHELATTAPLATVDIASVPDVIRTDGPRLRRILENLAAALDPARPGRIVARGKPLGGDLHELTIAVHGIALPADRIPSLFDGSAAGGGFGMAIGARLVALLGGTIAAAAEPDGRLVVRFTIPVDETTETGAAAVDPELGKRHPLRVLVAEDNLLNRKVAGAFLQKLGYEPRFATNGREALDAIERERFDVVFMDVDMPVLDGLAAARELRRLYTRDRSPRLVAVTANALPRDRAECLEAGFDHYLSKPLQIEQLASQLAKSARIPDAPIDPSTLDVDVLKTLDSTLGREIVAELVATYEADARELVAALETASHRGDATALARAAHTLKSISAALGAVSLKQICAELEQNGRSGTLAGAGPLVARAGQELSQVRVAMNEHVARERAAVHEVIK